MLKKGKKRNDAPTKKEVQDFVHSVEIMERGKKTSDDRAAFLKNLVEISSTIVGSALLGWYISKSPTFRALLKKVMSNEMVLRLARRIPGLVKIFPSLVPLPSSPKSTTSRLGKAAKVMKYVGATLAWYYVRQKRINFSHVEMLTNGTLHRRTLTIGGRDVADVLFLVKIIKDVYSRLGKKSSP